MTAEFSVEAVTQALRGAAVASVEVDVGGRAEMVKDRAWQSPFTLGPPRITGAVQAIINPIDIK